MFAMFPKGLDATNHHKLRGSKKPKGQLVYGLRITDR